MINQIINEKNHKTSLSIYFNFKILLQLKEIFNFILYYQSPLAPPPLPPPESSFPLPPSELILLFIEFP